ncbi:MAG: hypothetical protein F4137_02265 [Acidobacteria bacterium]|nr:hypothetical protein [Acidobacteriota bacterium]
MASLSWLVRLRPSSMHILPLLSQLLVGPTRSVMSAAEIGVTVTSQTLVAAALEPPRFDGHDLLSLLETNDIIPHDDVAPRGRLFAEPDAEREGAAGVMVGRGLVSALELDPELGLCRLEAESNSHLNSLARGRYCQSSGRVSGPFSIETGRPDGQARNHKRN